MTSKTEKCLANINKKQCNNRIQAYSHGSGSFSYCQHHAHLEIQPKYLTKRDAIKPHIDKIFPSDLSNVIITYIYDLFYILQFSLSDQNIPPIILNNLEIIIAFGPKNLQKTAVANLNTGLCKYIIDIHNGSGLDFIKFKHNEIIIRNPEDNIDTYNFDTKIRKRLIDKIWGDCHVYPHPNGKIIVGGDNYELKMFNPTTLQYEFTFLDIDQHTIDIQTLPNGKIITSSRAKTLNIWNQDTGICEYETKVHLEYHVVRKLILSNGYIIGGLLNGIIYIWDQTLTKKCEFKGHTDCILSIAVLNTYIITCSRDKSIRIWNLDLYENIPRVLNSHFSIHNISALHAQFLPDMRVIFGTDDGSVIIWDFIQDTINTILHIKNTQISQINILFDGRILITSISSANNVKHIMIH